jgi:hypothetical protein
VPSGQSFLEGADGAACSFELNQALGETNGLGAASVLKTLPARLAGCTGTWPVSTIRLSLPYFSRRALAARKTLCFRAAARFVGHGLIDRAGLNRFGTRQN